MHYLTNFYKNKAEQLQERVNFLITLLSEGVEDMSPDDIEKWLDDNTNNPDQRSQMRDLLYRKRARKYGREAGEQPGQSTGSSQSSREEEMRQENARRRAEGAQAEQAEQDRARRQAEADERWRQRANQASAEEAARRSGAGAQTSSGPQTGSGERPGSGQDPFEEFAERVRQGYREAYRAGAESEQKRQTAADAEYAKWEKEQHARDAAADERIRAEEEAGKFSNRAKKAASGAWEAAKAATDAEMGTPTFSAMGRYAQKMFQKPGETAKAAASGIGSAAAYSVRNPLKTTGTVVGTVANIGIPLAAGIGAEAVSDKAMEMMGFERNQPENERNVLTQIFSEKPSARSLVNYSTMFGATDAAAQAMSNAKAIMNRSIPSSQKPGLMSGTGRQAVRGGIAGALAHLTGHVFYKAGEALGQKLGLHDNLGAKEAVAVGQHAPGQKRLSDYPSVEELQAQSRGEARRKVEKAEELGLETHLQKGTPPFTSPEEKEAERLRRAYTERLIDTGRMPSQQSEK